MSWIRPEERTPAYHRGYNDRIAQHPYSANPYRKRTLDARDWSVGWLKAQHEINQYAESR